MSVPNYVPAAASNLATAPGATSLIMAAYNKQLRTEMVLEDLFETISSEIESNESGTVIPDAVYLKLNATPQGANTVTVPMLMALSASGQLGRDNAMLGNEESLSFKYLTMHFNEVKKSVASLGWGVDEEQISWMNAYKQITPLMGNWFKEVHGRRIRQALVLSISEELAQTPTSLTYQINPNVFIPGLSINSQPSNDNVALANANSGQSYPKFTKYVESGTDSTNSFLDQVMAGLSSVSSSFTSFATNILSAKALAQLSYYCQYRLRLEPIMLGGKATYIFLVSPDQAAIILDPTVAGSMGNVWMNVTKLTDEEANFPGVLGRYKNLLFAVDARTPTLTFGGSSGAYTMLPGFMNPGNNDGRGTGATTSGNMVWDCNVVLGRAAICEWVVQQVQYATESTEYGKYNGRGAYELSGIQIVKYDNDTPASTTYRQNGSCLVLTAKPTL